MSSRFQRIDIYPISSQMKIHKGKIWEVMGLKWRKWENDGSESHVLNGEGSPSTWGSGAPQRVISVQRMSSRFQAGSRGRLGTWVSQVTDAGLLLSPHPATLNDTLYVGTKSFCFNWNAINNSRYFHWPLETYQGNNQRPCDSRSQNLSRCWSQSRTRQRWVMEERGQVLPLFPVAWEFFVAVCLFSHVTVIVSLLLRLETKGGQGGHTQTRSQRRGQHPWVSVTSVLGHKVG